MDWVAPAREACCGRPTVSTTAPAVRLMSSSLKVRPRFQPHDSADGDRPRARARSCPQYRRVARRIPLRPRELYLIGGSRELRRTLALGHVKTPLHGVGATARRTTQTPRRPNGAGGARGASRAGSASVTTMHALFTTEVECKMASVRADLFLHSSENFESHDHA
jgi:hypothetical protein